MANDALLQQQLNDNDGLDVNQQTQINNLQIGLNNKEDRIFINSLNGNKILDLSIFYNKLFLNNLDIPYIKLNLNNSIVNADIASNAQISHT